MESWPSGGFRRRLSVIAAWERVREKISNGGAVKKGKSLFN